MRLIRLTLPIVFFAQGLTVLSARPIPHSLEDVFISRIQAREAEAAQTGGAL